MSEFVDLPADTNQARGIAQYAIDFMAGKYSPSPAEHVWQRLEQFHVDSVACGVSALAAGCNAPTLLRQEALAYAEKTGATCYGSRAPVKPEKAVLANCSAVREWDANGTNFGYDPARGHTAGEFGHNDYYPVAIAAAQQAGLDGAAALRGMLAIDEIRGRLAEVYSLKSYEIDHVLYGAIASAAVYGAMLGATVDQLESAIGLVVAHYIPFRAIRHGKQLSDSKGASAAISAEVAVLSAQRAMRGFVGPADIFRNPEAVFCLFQPPAKAGTSPFDLNLATGGNDFTIMGMHFKLGLYEHQSAGAIQALMDVLARQPRLLESADQLRSIRIAIYEPAFHIICDPAKRDPRTRQSADHSMPYIIATLLRKAIEQKRSGWKELMLLPQDYDNAALNNTLTRQLIEKVEIRHGGPEYDSKYPDGIPTTLEIDHAELGTISSGLVMYPLGHARNKSPDLDDVLRANSARWRKWRSKIPARCAAAFPIYAKSLLPTSPACTTFPSEACEANRMALFGLLNISKPRGETSRWVDDQVQWLAHPAKVGHAGTLDPLASGVLLVCIGQATRLMGYLQQSPKSYRAEFLLGRTSTTEDIHGELAEIENPPQPTRDEIEKTARRFVGEIQQRPPVFSALKVGGRPAYKFARKGQAVELAPRPVTIHRLELIEYEYPRLVVDVDCSSGTYMRSLGATWPNRWAPAR